MTSTTLDVPLLRTPSFSKCVAVESSFGRQRSRPLWECSGWTELWNLWRSLWNRLIDVEAVPAHETVARPPKESGSAANQSSVQPEHSKGLRRSPRWNVQHDDQGTAPVAQKDKDHQPGQAGTEQTFVPEAVDGAGDIRRLIELERDLDVVGKLLCIVGRADLISSMTDMVEASARFVARM